MLKKILGFIFSVGTIALIVWAAMGRGDYRSLLFKPSPQPAAVAQPATQPAAESVEEVVQVQDSTATDIVTDNIVEDGE